MIFTIIEFIRDTNKTANIIFFIEDRSHLRFSVNLIQYFLKHNFFIKVLCLENPFDKERIDSKIEIIQLQNNIEKIKYLKNLTGSLFFTTTPSIGTSIFPKSQVQPIDKRPKYIYLFHSLVSPNEMYIKNSFKNFDYIFSPSKIISHQLNGLVSNHTKIFETGYLLFDEIDVFKFSNNKNNKILLAPTWGDGVKEISKDINKIYQFAILNNLSLVFRPHPMTDIKSLKLNSEIIIDKSKNLDNLNEYSSLITDFSGIALEYFYLTGRPVIFLDVVKKVKRKLKNKEKDLNLIENSMRNILGKILKIDELINFDIRKIETDTESKKFIESLNYNKSSLNRTVEIIKTLT